MQPSDGSSEGPRFGEFRFCPRCGSAFGPADFHPAQHLFLCPSCSFDFYQNPVPAAVVALGHPERADSVLLLRRRTPPGIGLWCVPGGFIGYGERPEAAAAREVREEVGVDAEIGPVLRAGLVDYLYRGRRICILEVAYMARPRAPFAGLAASTAEASEISFRPADEVLADPWMLAFPEQIEVIRAYKAAAGGWPPP